MSSIDERIVKMTFDNSSFEKGVNQTIQSLEKLNQVLKNTGNADAVNNLSKSMKDIQAQLKTLNLDELNNIEVKDSIWKKIGNALSTAGKGLGNFISKLDLGGSIQKLGSSFSEAVSGSKGLDKSVESVTSRFSALGVMGVTALANITNKMVDLGTNMLKSLTIEPLMTGFSEYETKMGSIQTILANTAHHGTDMDDVTKVLNDLNTYSDKTIYNFAEMAKNIGTFTAAGIDLDTSAASIKGIANLAALSGSNSQQASTAMYQLSQALAAGRVSLADWNSVVNAGMGGKLFQDALIRTSEHLGTGAEKMIEKYGSFRESLTKGEWMTAEVLTETLKQLSGAYTEADLIAQGYTDKQAKEIMELAKTGEAAATEVKTVTQLVDTMKESVQSGWAQSWEHIIGDKEQATEVLTSISKAFEDIIGPSTEARNEMLKFWNQNGGRDAIIKGFTNVFKDLGKVMGSIGDAWEDVFPSMTGEKLVELSNKFKDFTEKMKLSDSTVGKIKDTFKGIFNVFKTVGSAVSSVIKAFSPLTAVFPAIGNAVLSVTSVIGKFVTSLSDALSQSKVFDKIASGIKGAFEGVGDIFTNVSKGFDEFFSYIGNLDFSKAFSFIGKGFDGVGEMLEPIMSGIGKALSSIDFNTIMNAMKTGTFLKVLQTLKGTFEEVGGIAETAKGAFKSFSGLGKNIKDTLNAAREALEAWQNNLQADMLMKIAGAVALLAASLILISTIDGNKLFTALGGMAAVMTELSLAYIAMMKYGGVTSLFSKGIGGSLLAIATSVLILAAALKILSGLDAGGILTGITGILTALGALALGVKVLNSVGGNLKQSAASLVIFGVAMMTMAGALKMLGSIDAETLGSGLFAMFGVLTELALFLAAAKYGDLGISNSVGILVLSGALLVLSQAVKEFGQLDPTTILTGLAAIGAMLAEIAIFSALAGSGSKMILIAAGLTAMSVAMLALSGAMKAMGSLQWDTIARGLTSMAGALLILGTATALISGPQMLLLAVGLSAMGVALTILGGALKLLGTQSWEEVAVSLVSLAGALAILAVAMYAMTGCIAGAAAMLVMAGALALFVPQLLLLSQLSWTEVAVGLVALAGAFAVIGAAGYLLVGALPGLLGLAAAIALFGVGAAAAGAGMALFGTGFAAVAAAISASGFLIIEFVKQLITLLPQIGLKAGEAMVNFAGAIANGAPQIITAFSTLLTAILTAIQQNIPLIAQTGVDIIVAFAQALATGIPQLVTAGCEMILGVLQGIANNIGPIVEAGADICINFMDGVAAKLPEIIDSGINLALSFIEGVAEGISNNSGRLESAIEAVIEAMVDAALAVLNGSINGFVQGGEDLVNGLIDGIVSLVTGVAEAAGRLVDAAIDGLGDCGTALYSAGENLVKGFCNGISSALSWVGDKAREIASKAKSAAEAALGIKSPSRVFMEIGRYTTEGFAVGLDKYAKNVIKPANNLAEGVLNNVRNPLTKIAKVVNDSIDANPTITPVLDLSNVEQNSRRLGDLVSGNGTLSLMTDKANLMTKSIGQIQNGKDNSDIVSVLKDLKDNLGNNGPSYTINGITYDDGSNVVNAVETLVRAARIERRI